MSKAFDSISMDGLKISMERLDIPSNIINLLVNLFKDRKIRIITHYGLSEPFTAGDGIDQGEMISPLLWRIFYDPLLTYIDSEKTLGYTLSISSIDDVRL